MDEPRQPPIVVGKIKGLDVCDICRERFPEGTAHQCSVHPWKLSGNAITALRELGVPMPNFITHRGVAGDLWDQRLFSVLPEGGTTEDFLGLGNKRKWRDLIFKMLFDDYGECIFDVEIDDAIDGDNGNYYEKEAPHGPFAGRSVLILRGKDIKTHITENEINRNKITSQISDDKAR